MKLFVKVVLGLGAVIIMMAVAAFVYFGSGKETYPAGLGYGQLAPEFEGEDQYGKTVNLSALAQEGDVVLLFFRGTWCPLCNKHIAALQDSLKQIEDKGATVVAITPEKPEVLGEDNFKTSVDIPVIYDKDFAISDKYDVTYELSVGSQRIFDVAGVDFESIYDEAGKMPIPATYIIGNDLRIKYVDVNEGGLKVSYSSVKQILAAL